ncbi:MAG: hypothetical protein K8R54_11595 [Bacteroidales bacterium]|nr:hypothetical protein [Bacteroidales bacterium]
MKLFLTILILSLTVPIFSQNDTIIDGISYNFIKTYRNGDIKILGNKNSYNNRAGHWIKYTRKGKIKYEGNYINNRKNGIWALTDKFGRCCWTGTYINGFKEGEWTRGSRATVVFRKGIKVRFIISKSK